jgi:hypothetical protein
VTSPATPVSLPFIAAIANACAPYDTTVVVVVGHKTSLYMYKISNPSASTRYACGVWCVQMKISSPERACESPRLQQAYAEGRNLQQAMYVAGSLLCVARQLLGIPSRPALHAIV